MSAAGGTSRGKVKNQRSAGASPAGAGGNLSIRLVVQNQRSTGTSPDGGEWDRHGTNA